MPRYLTTQIELGRLNYNEVVAKYPQFKDGIDQLLLEDGYKVNGDGTVSKIIEDIIITPLRKLTGMGINQTGNTLISSYGACTYEYLLEEGKSYTFTKESSSITRYGFMAAPITKPPMPVYNSFVGAGADTSGTIVTPVGKCYCYLTYGLTDYEGEYPVVVKEVQ